MKYSLFIGRWQPWHSGHRWLIDERLKLNKNVLIAIREVSKDDKNPYDNIYYLNTSNVENLNDTSHGIRFLSNGFKMHGTSHQENRDGYEEYKKNHIVCFWVRI